MRPGRRGRLAAPDADGPRRLRRRPRRHVREWGTLLDLLDGQGRVLDERIGYWGLSMGTMIGLPFVAGDPRVRCAVLGLACLSGWPNEAVRRDAARRVEVPVLFVLQWDDQLMTRASGLELFDALGSSDKRLTRSRAGTWTRPCTSATPTTRSSPGTSSADAVAGPARRGGSARGVRRATGCRGRRVATR